MPSEPPLSPKQREFILNSNKKYNLAHGSVRAGKTVCSFIAFLKDVMVCPGDDIYIFGASLSTIWRNVVSLIFSRPEFAVFKPLCTWSKSDSTLCFGPKRIKCIGAGDEGALGIIQGLTCDLCYCDEMTLYPLVIINMIDTRISRPHSKLFASMNPTYPDHPVKGWIDRATEGDPLYYALHFSIEDNIFLTKEYKDNLARNLKGLFYKRYYLGLWCMAEGAVYDFFDRKIHVYHRDTPPTAAEYFIAGVDYGTSQVFCCLILGINTGRATQSGKKIWVEKEYYWDVSQTKRQKTNAEYLRDLQQFFGDYPIRSIYVDPSASSFKLELRRAHYPMVDADNDVFNGIQMVAREMAEGNLVVLPQCRNLIREIEGYVWDPRKIKLGVDAPLKKNDHACFVAGTLVEGAGPIEAIKVGDRVMTRNGMRPVTHLLMHRKECFDFEIANRTITCTADHPFFTVNRGWVPASELTQLDTLVTLDGNVSGICSDPVPRSTAGIQKVYNITVDEDHEYFADGILVSNCDALRYAIATHKVPSWRNQPPEQAPGVYMFGR